MLLVFGIFDLKKTLNLLHDLISTQIMRAPISVSDKFCPKWSFPPRPCATHCRNLFLDCTSPGGFRSALLSFRLRIPSKSHRDFIGRSVKYVL